MSFNLVDLIKDQLTDQVTGYVSNMLGGDSGQASSVLGAALPALLGSLMNSSSTSNGAGALFDTISNQDDSMLDNIGDLLSGDGASSMMSAGSSVLGSLLGGNSNGGLGSIVDSVSGFAGSDKTMTKSIMGMLAPIIFSVIKKKFMSGDSGFDVGSLVDMFTGQKENITAALPKGLELNFENSAAFETPRDVTPKAKSGLGKLLPLALLLGAGWMAYNMFFKGSDTVEKVETVERVNHTTTQVSHSAKLEQRVEGTMTSLISTLSGIKDVSSAKASIFELTETTNNLGNYATMLDKIPADARVKVSKSVMDSIPQLKGLLNKAGSIPGVEAMLEPVIKGLTEKLALFQ